MIRSLARALLRAALVLFLLALLLVAYRILAYRQVDDSERLARKVEYLERLAAAGAAGDAPNVVLILFDDLGYGDLGAYGGRALRTPTIDRLAAEGLMFRAAYAASPYCSASRAGLLTGRHAVRSGMDHVLQAPWSWQDLLLRLGGRNRRLPAEEITLSEALSAAGYATAIYGKWHLGDVAPSRPTDRGFDHFWGLHYSNDQGEPRVVEARAGEEAEHVVEEHPVDQTTLTRRYTQRAVDFIERSAGSPFFLYLPHTFPHVPLHVRAERAGRSAGGLYGDVVEELDESVGAVVAALESAGVAERTLLLVSSDNGPWFQGSSGAWRGRKFDVFEGGTRVPLVAWWPGGVGASRPDRSTEGGSDDGGPGAAAAISSTPVSLLDVFPTALELARLPLPSDRVVDGVSLAALLARGEPLAERAIVFHQLGVPRALRRGRFKYHDRHAVTYGNPMNWIWSPNRYRGPWLFDLESDPSESWDASRRHPEVARVLAGELAAWRAELERDPAGWR